MPKAKDFNALLAYLRSQAPQPGMFSTLDELISVSPREEMSPQQWREWLQTGRMLEREGIQFPLKKAEIEETELENILETFEFEGGRNETISREDLAETVQTARPEFRLSELYREANEFRAGDVRVGENYPRRAWEGLSGDINEWITDPEIIRRIESDRPRFETYNLHHTSPGSRYEESVTRAPDLTASSFQHFGPDTLSHSRATIHTIPPEGPVTGPGPFGEKVRLVEEIQSDYHSRGHERGYREPSDYDEIDRLREIRDDPEDIYSLAQSEAANLRLNELRLKPEKAPFSDPKEYARVELSKQLLDAVRNDEDYLALTRGSDQIQRYSEGMDERRMKGMRDMYDKAYLSVLKKLGKRYGAELVDVKLPVGTKIDSRLPTLVDFGAENWDDMSAMIADAAGDDINDFAQTAEYMRRLLDDFTTELGDRDPIFVEASVAIQDLSDETQRLLTRHEGHWDEIGKVLDDIESDWITNYARVDRAMQRVEDYYTDVFGAAVQEVDKTFPALRLTPEVKEKIKKAGVPLFSVTGALGIAGGQQEPEGFAKGGKVVDMMEWLKREAQKEITGDDLANIPASGMERLPPGPEFEAWFEKFRREIDDRARAKQDAVNKLEYKYKPGDLVRGAKFRHRILHRTTMKDGTPGYYVENIDTESEYILPEHGILGKFEGPKKFAEGGSVEDDDRPSLSWLRAVGRSMANQIPFIDDETRERIGDTITHVPSGFLAQWTGTDPETGRLLNPLDLASRAMLNMTNADELYPELVPEAVPPGVIDETMALPLLFGEGLAPDWAVAAGERADTTRHAVRDAIGLPDPTGFLQHTADAGGMMLGQLPIPAAWFRRAKEPAQGALRKVGRVAGAIPNAGIEFLSPIIEPRIGNYIAGALFGGTIGAVLEPGEETPQDIPPDIEALVIAAENGNREAYNTLLEIYEEFERQQMDERLRQLGQLGTPGFAKGGDVGKALETLKAMTRRDFLKGIGAVAGTAVAGGKAAQHSDDIDTALRRLEETVMTPKKGVPGRDLAETFRKADLSDKERSSIEYWLNEVREAHRRDLAEVGEENWEADEINEIVGTVDRILDADPDEALDESSVEFLREVLEETAPDLPDDLPYEDLGFLNEGEIDELLREMSTPRAGVEAFRREMDQLEGLLRGKKGYDPESKLAAESVFNDGRLWDDVNELQVEDLMDRYGLTKEQAMDAYDILRADNILSGSPAYNKYDYSGLKEESERRFQRLRDEYSKGGKVVSALEKLRARTGLHKPEGIEVPEGYVSFEGGLSKNGKHGIIYGIKEDGTRQEISRLAGPNPETAAEFAEKLAKLYNMSGYTTEDIERLEFSKGGKVKDAFDKSRRNFLKGLGAAGVAGIAGGKAVIRSEDLDRLKEVLDTAPAPAAARSSIRQMIAERPTAVFRLSDVPETLRPMLSRYLDEGLEDAQLTRVEGQADIYSNDEVLAWERLAEQLSDTEDLIDLPLDLDEMAHLESLLDTFEDIPEANQLLEVLRGAKALEPNDFFKEFAEASFDRPAAIEEYLQRTGIERPDIEFSMYPDDIDDEEYEFLIQVFGGEDNIPAELLTGIWDT